MSGKAGGQVETLFWSLIYPCGGGPRAERAGKVEPRSDETRSHGIQAKDQCLGSKVNHHNRRQDTEKKRVKPDSVSTISYKTRNPNNNMASAGGRHRTKAKQCKLTWETQKKEKAEVMEEAGFLFRISYNSSQYKHKRPPSLIRWMMTAPSWGDAGRNPIHTLPNRSPLSLFWPRKGAGSVTAGRERKRRVSINSPSGLHTHTHQ